MKRREWLKSLFCAPLALLPTKKVAAPVHLDYWWSDDSEAFETIRKMVEDQVTVRIEGSLIRDCQVEDAVFRGIESAQRRGRLS